MDRDIHGVYTLKVAEALARDPQSSKSIQTLINTIPNIPLGQGTGTKVS
jgi:hypothetical protein